MASEATGPDDLYARADRAMYASKQNGRNRLTRHSTLASRTGKNWMLYRKE
jgi:diguanylate cyclase